MLVKAALIYQPLPIRKSVFRFSVQGSIFVRTIVESDPTLVLRKFSTSILQKPRFEDNGDIEPCDTETRMMMRPDDFGVNEASSVSSSLHY